MFINKQKIVDIYNRLESWIIGVIFLIFGIWLTNIYQAANTMEKQTNNDGFFYWVLYIDKFQVLLALLILGICIFCGYKLKNLPTSKEIELRNNLKKAEDKSATLKNKNEQLNQ